jgi:hypothetical protein
MDLGGKLMLNVKYGRKTFSFDGGAAVHTRTTITEKANAGEDEQSFTQRLLKKYENQRGDIEIVFKNGRPDYAIVTLS